MSHWYSQDEQGKVLPRHFEGKGGKGTTLRDARRLQKAADWIFPSVTGIGQVRAKPALETWKTEQAVMKAWRWHESYWTPDQPQDFQILEWARKIIREAQQEVYAKADAGTEIHDALEAWYTPDSHHAEIMGWVDLCVEVDSVLKNNCAVLREVWIPEAYVVDPELGYGGKCDLYCWDWVIDFKTKDEVDEKTRGYAEQAEQLAAYRQALAKAGKCSPTARLANLFISRTDHAIKFYEHTDANAWNRFYHTLVLWQVCKKYGPIWEQLNETN